MLILGSALPYLKYDICILFIYIHIYFIGIIPAALSAEVKQHWRLNSGSYNCCADILPPEGFP